jgi:hypothetical protein
VASFTLTAPAGAAAPGREVFDQTWAIPNPALVADETYQWTVDGVQFELAVAGRSVARTPGAALNRSVPAGFAGGIVRAGLAAAAAACRWG